MKLRSQLPFANSLAPLRPFPEVTRPGTLCSHTGCAGDSAQEGLCCSSLGGVFAEAAQVGRDTQTPRNQEPRVGYYL